MTDPAAPVPPPSANAAPWGLPLLGAAALLAAVPLGATFFVYFAQALRLREDDLYGGADDVVSQAFAMGGWAMYAVLGVGLLVSLASAVFVLFAARQNALFALPMPVFAALPAALGAAGAGWGLNGAILAVQHASPADRATILAASVGEATWSSTLGACVAAGLSLSTAAALVFAALTQQKRSPVHARGLFTAAAGVGALAVLAWLGAMTTQAASMGWQAIANSTREVALVREVVGTLTQAQSRVAIATLAIIVVAVVLAASVRGAAPGARVAFGLSLVLSAGLTFISVRAKPSRDLVESFARDASKGTPLYRFDAPRANAASGIPLEGAVNEDVEMAITRARDLHAAADDYAFEQNRTAFELWPDVTALSLRTALTQAAKLGVTEVTLLTGGAEPPSDLPPPFDSLVRQPRGVEVKLLFKDTDCPCDELVLEEGGVRLGDERWPFGRLEDKYVDRYAQPVTLKLDEALTVDVVLKAAVAANAHERRLGLVLEGAAPNARPRGYALEPEPEPQAPLAKAAAEVKVLSGPLSAAALKRSAELQRLASCVEEETKLPVTVEVEVAVSELGAVMRALPLQAEPDELTWCVADSIDFAPAEKAARGFTLARVQVTLSAAAPAK